jgi:hypothetical protein
MNFNNDSFLFEKLVQAEVQRKLNEHQKTSERFDLANNISADGQGVNFRVHSDESSAVSLLIRLLNLAPSQEEFETKILPWLKQKVPYLHNIYKDNQNFFDVMAPKIVGAATVGVGLYKLKNYLSHYFGFSSPTPGTRKRGRPRKDEQ